MHEDDQGNGCGTDPVAVISSRLSRLDLVARWLNEVADAVGSMRLYSFNILRLS
jgi:hypothetical protein